MTIEQILSNSEKASNDIANKMNFKSKVMQVESSISDFFNFSKKNIMNVLRELTDKRWNGPNPLSMQAIQDPEIMKVAINFIKKQAYNNLDQLDNIMNSIFENDNDDKEEAETDTEKQVEIPVSITTVPASTNFGY